MHNPQSVIIGSRQSKLATWQADYVAAQLRTLYSGLNVTIRFFITHGDRVLDKSLPEIGGKGVFTAELEAALHMGEIDIAVHSLKDLPTESHPAFVIGAVPLRASPYDVLISRSGQTLANLPNGASIGTSSLRRAAQIKAVRPDVHIISLRGNVPTRIEKALNAASPYDAIVLAQAGLERLDMIQNVVEVLSPTVMLPAPAQGALGIQCRVADSRVRGLLAALDHAETHAAVDAERAFLAALDSGCRLPVAALAYIDNNTLHLTGRVASLNGATVITVEGTTARNPGNGEMLGLQLASQASAQGADQLLDAIRKQVNA